MSSVEHSESSPVPEVEGGRGVALALVRQTATDATARISQTHARLREDHAGYAVLAEIVQAIRLREPGLLAKQAAYSLLYAVPSTLLVLVSLAAIVDKNTGAGVSLELQQRVATQAPVDSRPLLAGLVDSAVTETSANAAVAAALVSLGIAIWGAAGGVGALMYAVNRVYDVRDTRSFIKATITRLGLMLLGGILVIGAFVLFTFGRRLAEWLDSGPVNLDSAVNGMLTSGPIWSLLLLFAALLLLYWFALDIAKSPRWLLPGAVAATLAVALTFALLEWILSFSNPGTAFGAAGGVLVLLWSLFILSQIVVIGAIVNAVLARRYDRTLIAALAQHPEKRLDRCDPAGAGSSVKHVVVSHY